MYTLTYFGQIALPEQMPVEDIGTGSVELASYPLSSGGAFDGLGSEVATIRGTTITKKAKISGANAQVEYVALRGMLGKKEKLYRQWSDGNIEWVTARLKKIESDRTVKHRQHIDVTLEFEVYSAYWHGELIGQWYLDDGNYLDTGLNFDSGDAIFTLDASPKSVIVNQPGNAIVKDSILTLTAADSNITAFTIQGNGSHLVFSGTILAGKSLVIDCGEYTVENDGIDAIANFSLGANHAINEWMHLDSGDNSFTITFTGGGTTSTIDFSFYAGAY